VLRRPELIGLSLLLSLLLIPIATELRAVNSIL
jgi:hypothetical protein